MNKHICLLFFIICEVCGCQSAPQAAGVPENATNRTTSRAIIEKQQVLIHLYEKRVNELEGEVEALKSQLRSLGKTPQTQAHK